METTTNQYFLLFPFIACGVKWQPQGTTTSSCPFSWGGGRVHEEKTHTHTHMKTDMEHAGRKTHTQKTYSNILHHPNARNQLPRKEPSYPNDVAPPRSMLLSCAQISDGSLNRPRETRLLSAPLLKGLTLSGLMKKKNHSLAKSSSVRTSLAKRHQRKIPVKKSRVSSQSTHKTLRPSTFGAVPTKVPVECRLRPPPSMGRTGRLAPWHGGK